MRRTPLHRSLWKPILFMGCERVPFLIVALSSGLLVMEGSLWVKVVGVIYFIVMVGAMAVANSTDPFFFHILYRYIKYQDFYPANSLYPGQADKPNNFLR